MSRKTKGRGGWHQATPKTCKYSSNSTGLVARIKAAIVTLALWGLLPVAVVDWIIHRGGLCDA
ncbi:MAG: hypothetical protein RPU52_06260 [Candidatus Sedimenticola sp. (ex Thyasira tokunagai)]